MLAATPAHSEKDDEPVVVLVVGSRASLTTAQGIKREKLEIVDSIVAEDIGKLPDFSVTDAIQRVTGVQVARDRGDGTNVAIRGLTQMETTLNGREIFTAGNGRNLDFADVPAELLAGIDVYKTSPAHHLEGGVGGSVDLRTRRPFDFAQPQAAVAVRDVYGDLARQQKKQYSMLLSDRWKTEGVGELGALLSVSLQDRAWREDWKTLGSPKSIAFGGQAVAAPGGSTETTTTGNRKRTGASFALQWRPAQELDLYAEGNYTEFRTFQNTYQLSTSNAGATAGSLSLFPGTTDVQSITWTNASINTFGAMRDTTDRTGQIALGGTWTGKNLTLKADLSYTKSHNDLVTSSVTLNGARGNLSLDASPTVASSFVTGVNLGNLASFANANMFYAVRPFDGDLKALRMDAEYRVAGDVIDALSGGLRYARRHATDAPGLVTYPPSGTPGVAAGNAAGFVSASPIGDFFPGATSIGGYLVGNPSLTRNAETVRQALGLAAPIPTSNPLGTWDITEETSAAYAMATIRAADMPLDGNAGVRIVRTKEALSGYRGSAGSETPIASGSRYTDILPSLNLRYEIADRLYLRGAASRTITRPDFLQLSPSLILNNAIPARGNAGNPTLRPVRSNNVDLAVERYFGKSSSIHATLFNKRVDGFVINTSAPEVHGGVTYEVTRPYNANMATVDGLEIGYQQFYDSLPGWLSGFGIQANYTYVDSNTFDRTLQRETPLQNLSRNSLNLIGLYERGRVSARIAYNWRDKFVTGVGNYANIGVMPTYMRAYGWLDASFSYRYSDKLTLTLEGNNLLRTVRRSYYGVETRPADAWINDRQIVVAASLRF